MDMMSLSLKLRIVWSNFMYSASLTISKERYIFYGFLVFNGYDVPKIYKEDSSCILLKWSLIVEIGCLSTSIISESRFYQISLKCVCHPISCSMILKIVFHKRNEVIYLGKKIFHSFLNFFDNFWSQKKYNWMFNFWIVLFSDYFFISIRCLG